MRCPTCTHDNPEDARFCSVCGTPLAGMGTERLHVLRGFIPPDVARRILAAGGLGERRTVTALFCDVVGSTALGERLGPERFKLAMDQLLGRLIAAVARYEGTVAQVLGDGLLAFFGAPLSHEDDAERAVRAALDIRRTVGAYGVDLEAAFGVSLQVRVALNTGPVVLSRVTDVLEVTYNALGDTVTTAARLQAAAAPGTILAAEGTWRLVAPLFVGRAIDPVTVKGKAAPVHAVEVVEPKESVAKGRGIVGLAAPLIGRERELAQLQESIHALTEGRGQIAAVIGEAGIGKSRLIAEVQRLRPDVRCLEGRCHSYAGAIPYFPFQDLVREWLEVTPADPEMRVRIELGAALARLFGSRADEVYPYLGRMLRLALDPEAEARLADLSAESLQHQTFMAMGQWAAALAAAQPLALILDDLHWADDTSLSLLESLLAVTEDAPVLLVLLFRPEREHASWRLNELARRRYPHRHVEIPLPGLAAAQAGELVRHLLSVVDLPPESRDVIVEKAEGNPFFVEEVIRGLIDAGVLVRTEGRWQMTRVISRLDVPDSVQGVLLARIDQLPERGRRVLQTAAVVGRLFSHQVLKAVLPEDGSVEAALVELQRHDLIIERRRLPVAEYRFKHALTQEVAYSTLTEESRRQLHREVARALETQYAERLEEAYGLLAYHYDQAADEDRAVHFLVRAGDTARAGYADQEALRHYARAVELMKQRGEWARAAATLMKSALAHHIAFDFVGAHHTYQEAFAILARTRPARPPAVPPATLRMSMADPLSFDPVAVGTPAAMLMANQLFEGLLRNVADLSVAPALARSWDISPDGTRYRLHLHPERRWSDGQPVTAHDVVAGWLRAMRGTQRSLFHDIRGARAYGAGSTDDPSAVGVRALDDHTVDFRLEGPRAYFPFILAHSAAIPIPRGAVAQHGDDWVRPGAIATNGPFLLAEWERNVGARLIANPDYAGPRSGNIAEIRFQFADWANPALFRAGDVDIQWLASLEDADAERVRPFLRLDPPQRVLYVFFRCDRPPFSDRRLRLAFAHATDRLALARTAGAYATPADGGFVSPAIPGHSPHIGPPFDPDRAQTLLAEAGYPDGQGLGPFAVLVPSLGEMRIYEALARTWRGVLSVEVRFEAARGNYLQEIHDHPPTIGRLAWLADSPDPDTFLRATLHSAAGHPSMWHHPRFDALVEEAQNLTDHRRRMALYHEADRLLVAEEAAVVPLIYTRLMYLIRPHVRGWWTTLLGHALFADLVVDRAPE